MLKWIGAVLMALSLLWIVIQRDSAHWGSVVAGATFATPIFLILLKPEKPVEAAEKQDEKLQRQMRLEEAEALASQTIDGLNREIQKLQKKSIRSEERCLSYQKLVEVHQQEIEKLRQEGQSAAQLLIQKERKLSEFYLAQTEPDLFSFEYQIKDKS